MDDTFTHQPLRQHRAIHVFCGQTKQKPTQHFTQIHCACTVKPPNKQPPMAEHTAYTEQFPWSQHAPLTYTWAENARF